MLKKPTKTQNLFLTYLGSQLGWERGKAKMESGHTFLLFFLGTLLLGRRYSQWSTDNFQLSAAFRHLPGVSSWPTCGHVVKGRMLSVQTRPCDDMEVLKEAGCIQCSDVRALSRSDPTFLWKDQFVLICHARLKKTKRFNSFMPKALRKFLWCEMGMWEHRPSNTALMSELWPGFQAGLLGKPYKEARTNWLWRARILHRSPTDTQKCP